MSRFIFQFCTIQILTFLLIIIDYTVTLHTGDSHKRIFCFLNILVLITYVKTITFELMECVKKL